MRHSALVGVIVAITLISLAGRTSPAAADSATSIAMGSRHACALTDNGGVKCWGWNFFGQLGDGSADDGPTPVDVIGLGSGVDAIEAGRDHTCALTDQGGVKCWGGNDVGQLGDGSNDQSDEPVDVQGLTSGVEAISVGDDHNCAVLSGGDLHCWGANGGRKSGVSAGASYNTPQDADLVDFPVQSVVAGGGHTCAISETGAMYCWGSNSAGQIGDGTHGGERLPTEVAGLAPGVEQMALGGSFTCALKTDGVVTCWGYNVRGQLGQGSNEGPEICTSSLLLVPQPCSTIPIDVPGLTDVGSISAGGSYACAVPAGRAVQCWGTNELGELGNGSDVGPDECPDDANPELVYDCGTSPRDVLGLDSAASVFAGGTHACAITNDSAVQCWGLNGQGQLGDGTNEDHYAPEDVIGFEGPPLILYQGDVNCDGDVDEDDMSLLLEFIAELTGGQQSAPCPDVNEPEPQSGFGWGDVNCDGTIDGLDALLIVLFIAAVELPDPAGGCFHVGDAIILTS